MMIRTTASLLFVALCIQTANAHFPWLAMDQQGKAQLFFGESPAERNYKLPAPIAKAKVTLLNQQGEAKEVALTNVEQDEFVGLVSEETFQGAKRLMSKVTYGMHAGSRLDYYAIHQAGPLPKEISAYASKPKDGEKASEAATATELDLNVQLVDTDSGVDVFVMWKGEPLANVDVKLYCEDGHEEGDATTDAKGKVSFTDGEVEDGLNGIMVGHKLDTDSGEWDGKSYTSSAHYLTVTFQDPQDFE